MIIDHYSRINSYQLVEDFSSTHFSELTVCVLVQHELYEDNDILWRIERYCDDIHIQVGVRTVIIEVKSDWDTNDIISTLNNLYENSNLVGTIIVGKIPVEYWESELYGLIPTISPYCVGGTWLGVIWPPINGSEGLTLIKDYFDRNHKYYTGEIKYAQRLLYAQSFAYYNWIYCNRYDIVNSTGRWNLESTIFVDPVNEPNPNYIDPEPSEEDMQEWKTNYLNKLTNGSYEVIYLNTHGTPTHQDYYITKDDLKTRNYSALMIMLDVCQNGKFNIENYLAGAYLFYGETLAVVADPHIHFGGSGWDYIYSWESGITLGQAYLGSPGEFIIFGDPVVRLSIYRPHGSLFSLDIGVVMPRGGETTYCLSASDFTGDGLVDWVAALRTPEDVNLRELVLYINQGIGDSRDYIASRKFIPITIIEKEDIKYINAPGIGFANTLASADFDNDGDIDILLAGNDPNTYEGKVLFFSNNGDGNFTFDRVATSFPGNRSLYGWPSWHLGGATCGDFNDDGKEDFILGIRYTLANAITPEKCLVQLYIQDIYGNFTLETEIEYASDNYPFGLTTNDFTGDGKLDLLVGDWWGNVTLFTNIGMGHFDAGDVVASVPIIDSDGSPFGGFAYGLTSADFNCDGIIDFVVGTRVCKLLLFLNDGKGNFTYEEYIPHAWLYGFPYGLISDDFDGDSDIDIISGGDVLHYHENMLFNNNIAISNFNFLFRNNLNVTIIYPSDSSDKPLGCGAAWVSDWLASAFIYTKLENVIEGLDTEEDFVNQTTGKALGDSGTGIVSFGGQFVNPVVKYAESDGTPDADKAPVKFYLDGSTFRFQYRNGTNIPGAELPQSVINLDQDMFVIEVYEDGDGRYMMLCYGFGWKGTYAAGKYFHTEIYPDLASYPYSWIIVKWDDANGNGFVNTGAEGDTFTVIATGS